MDEAYMYTKGGGTSQASRSASAPLSLDCLVFKDMPQAQASRETGKKP